MNADRVLIGGTVVTLADSDSETVSEASALAFYGGRIAAVGGTDDVRNHVGPSTDVIDLDGKTALPGFIDTHLHLPLAGRRMTFVNCRSPPNESIADVLHRIEARAAETADGEWVICTGYNLGLVWEEEAKHVDRWDLDDAAPENPVQVNSVGGHTGSIYNSAALSLAGIDRETPDPEPPAVIERDRDGRPSGLVSEDAEIPLLDAIGERTREERKADVERAMAQLLRWGVTTAHDARTLPEDLRIYQELHRERTLPIRIGAILAGDAGSDLGPEGTDVLESLASAGIQTGFGDEWLSVVGIKYFMGAGPRNIVREIRFCGF